ncbi:hypothetical protein [Rheinheimera soli]|uniref:Uncharacterized protein n=1 Tax=Rheinheimera soli TaxID=443616 RepID=A0ABU1W236_9GAMM|nr:hypothetical protein [Rheinheimera soli]MDR7121997.1 hypothetical protein [Rheinheimera soli]
MSDDNAGYQLKWSQVSGLALQLSNSTEQSLTIKAPTINEDTTAVLRLTLTDSAGQSVSDELTVSLKNNKLPTITATTLPALTEKSEAQLQVNVADPDGVVQSVQWQQLSGPVMQLTDTNKPQVKIQVPAVTTTEVARLRINVTDDDGEVSVLEKDVQIDPLWQQVHVSGYLSAKNMAGARVLAVVNNEIFHTVADASSGYSLTLKLDDDAESDFVIIKAESAAKPGMELFATVPSVLTQDPTLVTNLTPYSTAVVAMTARANQGVLPYSIDDLLHAEPRMVAAEVAEASILIAAFAEQDQVALPAGMLSVFSTIMQPNTYVGFKNALLQTQHDLLFQLSEDLPLNTIHRVDFTEAELSAGLRLTELDTEEYIPGGNRFYQFLPENKTRVADKTSSFEGLWSVLTGVLVSQVNVDDAPLYWLDVERHELGLDPEQLIWLQQAGITRLNVKLNLLAERLIRLSQSAGQGLYWRQIRIGYQVQPVWLKGELMESLPQEIETYDYMWGKALNSESLEVSERDLAGVWSLPLYKANDEFFAEQLQPQELVLQQNGEGYSRTSAETFVWRVRLDQNQQSVLTLSFSDGQKMDIRLLAQTIAGYQADLLYLNDQMQWLAADQREIKRL